MSDGGVGKAVGIAVGAAAAGALLTFVGNKLFEELNLEKKHTRQSKFAPADGVFTSLREEARRSQQQGTTTASSSRTNLEELDSFCCPITRELMVDPVTTPFGHSYERQAIERWIERDGTCPITKRPLQKSDLIPAINLRNAIAELMKGESHAPSEKREGGDGQRQEENGDDQSLQGSVLHYHIDIAPHLLSNVGVTSGEDLRLEDGSTAYSTREESDVDKVAMATLAANMTEAAAQLHEQGHPESRRVQGIANAVAAAATTAHLTYVTFSPSDRILFSAQIGAITVENIGVHDITLIGRKRSAPQGSEFLLFSSLSCILLPCCNIFCPKKKEVLLASICSHRGYEKQYNFVATAALS
uniref:U-box domain-containing protein n=1 Tax=Palpitomonas bilix TaxID=652834 RepID=A0A7S3D4M8_9EUKA|mmetsp:Transcript_21874/g.56804  ORF Transcript_21874/g.56804 Transcript_21874/m.56804 type:complete len:358 (+) Transcript_21874:90-1163(+)